VIIAGGWTFAVLCLVYGQAVYQDHVGYNVVSLGNSFLRYLLPLAPFFALSVGGLGAWFVLKLGRRRGLSVVVALVGILAVLGVWTAFSRDDEGLNAVLPELSRYGIIRQAVFRDYGPSAVVLSERSDKVFFPLMHAASPLPEAATIRELTKNYSGAVLLFNTTLDDRETSAWIEQGFMITPVFQTKNQTLYELEGDGYSTVATSTSDFAP